MARARGRQGLIGLLVVLGVIAMVAHHGADAQTTRESKSESRLLDKKLNEILAAQQTILQKLDAVMEELRIIKVRATLAR